MALPFFYLNQYQGEDRILLDEANSRHMVAVLRMQTGEGVQLTDGKGNLLQCRISEAHKKKAIVDLIKKEVLPPPVKKITIAISPVKNTTRFEWFLEKATEIGVSAIIPLIAQRTEKQQFRHDRMQQILISALMQSQQAWLPELIQPVRFADLIKQENYSQKWIAHCLDTERKSLRTQIGAGNNQLLLIGPEGDFTPQEIELALQAGFEAVTLGDTRLRTETAGLVGATLLCVS
ncbi:RsmE family RNA methyltransferase [Flavihumibacter sp. UBA7668]|uniref:RsmE family RNA methyltransferase n=1 Tax=Flavihumibacter sp. UBA7668 TaxID=1946542 RepID=UPI0025B86990|nr:RsmE family RNA methyltransferase [Flavihumibacter sp. UBA7668]